MADKLQTGDAQSAFLKGSTTSDQKVVLQNLIGPYTTPGPYANGTNALLAGVSLGAPYYKPDLTVAVARGSAFTINAFGDSITQNNDNYGYDAVIGTGLAMQYRMRASTPNPHTYTIAHVNDGASQSLSVTSSGTDIVVHLATNSSSVVTSTITQVTTAVLAQFSSILFSNNFGPSTADTDLAQVQGPTYFNPASYFYPAGVLAWLQVLMRHRFNFVRRLHNTYGSTNGNPEGDWTHGYAGQKAVQVIANPGPMGDAIQDGGDLYVGLIGANDLALSPVVTDPAILRDRIVALWDALTAVGKQFIWMEVPPSGNPSYWAVGTAANALLKPLAAARGILWIPWLTSFSSSGAALTTYFPDGTHPNNLACFLQATSMVPMLDAYIQGQAPNYSNPTDGTWITPNPNMTGDVSGAATGWHTFDGAFITPNKVSATDGGNDWQRIVVNQSGGYVGKYFNSPTSTSGVAPGDLIEGVAEIVCNTSGFDIKNITVVVFFQGAANGASAMSMRTFQNQYDFSLGVAFNGILRTPPVIAPHGTTSVNMAIEVYGSGDIKFRNAGVRKSTQA